MTFVVVMPKTSLVRIQTNMNVAFDIVYQYDTAVIASITFYGTFLLLNPSH